MGHLISLKLENLSDTRRPSSPPTTMATFAPVSILSSSTKRSRPGPVTNLTILPYTQEEWKTVMEEIRKLYLKGNYKQCAARCKQILEGISAKDPYRVHPLYSIYLSFFAASSMEITASSMSNHSSEKLPLFQEALSYYQKAESHVDFASFSADPTVINSARNSIASIISSSRSSVDSIFSHSYSASRSHSSTPVEDIERGTSPSSIASNDRKRPKKKVSFSEDVQDAETLLDSFPRPPSPESPTSTALITHESLPLTSDEKYNTYSSFLLAQSVSRYRTQLTSLSSQLQYHVASVHKQIASVSESRKNRRVGVTGTAWSTVDGLGHEEIQRAELKERIKKLKENGWQRKRFNPERYIVLCEMAIGEVDKRA